MLGEILQESPSAFFSPAETLFSVSCMEKCGKMKTDIDADLRFMSAACM
jgi:hypothetical protein